MQALKIDSASVELMIALGDVYKKDNQNKLAIECCKQVLKANPEKGYNCLSKVYLKLKEFNLALCYFFKSATFDSSEQKLFKYYYKLGYFFNYKINNKQMAIKYYKKAISFKTFAENEFDYLYLQLGNAYLDNFQYEQAIDSYIKQAIINQNKSFLYYNLGIAYLSLQRNTIIKISQVRNNKKNMYVSQSDALKKEQDNIKIIDIFLNYQVKRIQKKI
ncbi:hypothetical protein ABPG72_019415 [Tetrahymena utriculariae]